MLINENIFAESVYMINLMPGIYTGTSKEDTFIIFYQA